MTTSTISRAHAAARRLAAVGALALVAACSDHVAPPSGDVRAPVTISATLTPAQQAIVAGMSVEVTGPGITTPIIVTLSVSGATVNGTVQVPVGASRTFTVRAYDAQGRETYNGSATASVVAGTNPPLTVRMAAVEGNVPIDVTIASFGLTLAPATASVAVNGEATLTATLTGNVPTGTPTWGAINPALVTVTPSADGRSAVVRGRIAGSTRVVVAHAGVAAASTVTITVTAANQPPVARVNGPFSNSTSATIAFSSAGSSDPDGTIVSYLWSFGDGTTSTQPNPTKSYASVGSYGVTLTVTDNGGATATAQTAAFISAPPTGTLALSTVTAGGAHSCGLASGGVPYCWGDNTYGQLGNGTTTSSVQPVRPSVPNISFGSIHAGRNHTCAATTGGTIYCWGDNSWGQLGDGTTTSRATPATITTAPSGSVVSNSVSGGGDDHMCVRNGIDQRFYCWGRNDEGQAGGATAAVTRPTDAGDAPQGYTWQLMAAGGRHTCGMNNNTALNTFGTICRGGGKSAPPGFIFGSQLVTLAAGTEFTCGLGAGLWCWGDNSAGQLGRGTVSAQELTPVKVDIALTSLSAGTLHACGATSGLTGTGYCWGDNTYGQLGDGTTTLRSSPVAIPGGSMIGVSAGARHSCGVRNGNAYCWGDNSSGQLGDGTTTQRLVPTAVVAGVAPNQPPVLTMATQFTGRVNQPVTISAGCTDPDGDTIGLWSFSFSDGISTSSSTTGSVQHTFTAIGTFQVAASCWDSKGAPSQSKTAIVTIGP